MLHVRLPRQGLPGLAIAGIAIAAALILFLVLNGQRQTRATRPRSSGQSEAFVAPRPLAIPPPLPAPAPVVTIVTAPLPQAAPLPPPAVVITPAPSTPAAVPAAPESSPPSPARAQTAPGSAAPALVIDTAADAPMVGGPPGGRSPGGDSRSLDAGGGDGTPARATMIANRTSTVPVGTMIPIVLETPIDTARPGLVRAVASGDTRGFDGRRVLVPRGSRLIGEYQADVRSGQDRVLVNWTRLVRPDGTTIRLGSPAADQLGGAGVPGRVNTFFFQRFASAVLQSALTVGVNLASRPRAGSVVVGIPTGPISTIGQGLIPGSDLRPKITVKQGALLNVFVARDLDFSGTGTGQP